MELLFILSGVIPFILLVIVGAAVKYKKAYWLLSGYNTMSAEKKKNVDVEGLGNFAGNVCFIIAGILLLAGIFIFMEQTVIALILFSSLIPIAIFTIIKAQKYDGNTRDEKGKINKKSKIIVGAVVGVLVITGIGVGILLYFSNLPAEYTLQNGILKISGMYGQELPVYDIGRLELKEELPEILARTNGSELGTKLKGHFKLKEIGAAKLYIDSSKPPYIFMETQDRLIIFNSEERGKTEAFFQKLKTEWERSIGK